MTRQGHPARQDHVYRHLKTGPAHVQRYMKPLLQRIEKGEIDPTRIITHRPAIRRRGRRAPGTAGS